MKIVVLDGFTLNPGDISWREIEDLGQMTVYDRTAEDQIQERIGDAQIVFTNKVPLRKADFEKLPNLKYIGVLATGYNIVDTCAARERGIAVTNIPSYGTASVAQMTIALLLELCHRAGAHSDAVRSGAWAKSEDFCFWNYPLTELEGKTLGIIGYGKIGRRVAAAAAALGMKILAARRNVRPGVKDGPAEYAELSRILRESDVISLHCPLTETNRELICEDRIAKMKDGVFLINTARGGLINEKDLAAALEEGKVAGAAVDVLSREPASNDNPLLTAKNCIITPHIAWAPKEARQRLMSIAAANLRGYLDGKPCNTV